MYKRILVFVLLCASVCFSSCSSKKKTVESDNVIVPEAGRVNDAEKITYDEYLKQNYERQTESSKKLMKDNEKRSKEDTPLRPRKKSLFNRSEKGNSCSVVDDAVIKDGVRDIK